MCCSLEIVSIEQLLALTKALTIPSLFGIDSNPSYDTEKHQNKAAMELGGYQMPMQQGYMPPQGQDFYITTQVAAPPQSQV
jgi:hypothetical protein